MNTTKITKNAEKESFRILAQDVLVSNDTRRTGLNNNDLIIGPSGAGKTRGYVMPNIAQCAQSGQSIFVTDTKNSLHHELRPLMERNGYRVLNVDFTNMVESCGYNPLDYVRYDEKRGKYSEQDIVSITACLVPIEDPRQAIWEQHARTYMSAMIAYVLECLPPEEHTLQYVMKLFCEMNTGVFDTLFQELGDRNPDSFAWTRYQMFKDVSKAEKMNESIRGIIAEKLDPLTFDGPLQMYSRPEKVDFAAMGREKTALFLNISDTDRSCDRLVNLFYTQALQTLCGSADRCPGQRLPVPVRLILDDFASNAEIPDFDKIISVIRSREISVSIILQSLSQLYAIYGQNRAETIINNCDNCLYLGGQDSRTAEYFSRKANRALDTILNLPLDAAYLFTRGAKPRQVKKYDLRTHPLYSALPESGGPGRDFSRSA